MKRALTAVWAVAVVAGLLWLVVVIRSGSLADFFSGQIDPPGTAAPVISPTPSPPSQARATASSPAIVPAPGAAHSPTSGASLALVALGALVLVAAATALWFARRNGVADRARLTLPEKQAILRQVQEQLPGIAAATSSRSPYPLAIEVAAFARWAGRLTSQHIASFSDEYVYDLQDQWHDLRQRAARSEIALRWRLPLTQDAALKLEFDRTRDRLLERFDKVNAELAGARGDV